LKTISAATHCVRRWVSAVLLCLASFLFFAGSALSQSDSQAPYGYPTNTQPTQITDRPVQEKKAKSNEVYVKPFRQFAIGGFVGTTGFGGEAAMRLLSNLNVRGGGEYFTYSGTFTNNGMNIAPTIEMGETFATLDWFPFHNGFRISPGVMINNLDNMSAKVNVPAGQQFSIGTGAANTYYSSSTNPLYGSANLSFPAHGYRFTIGHGNMIPLRRNKYVTFPFEFGIVYFNSPTINLNFGGVVCQDQAQTMCSNADPTVQEEFNTSVANEQAKLQRDDFNQTYAHFYPILKFGVAVKF